MNRHRCLLAALLLAGHVSAQPLDLASCYQKAEAHHPLRQQQEIIRASAEAQARILDTRHLPQVSLSGQAALQSDAVAFPSIPNLGIEFPEVPLFQYRLAAEVQQSLYDGGAVRDAKILLQAESAAQEAQVQADLFQVRQAVSQLFFAARLQSQQAAILRLAIEDLGLRRRAVASAVEAGAALPSQLLALDKQRRSLEQQLFQAEADRRAALRSLEVWIGEEIPESAELPLPQQAQPGDPARLRPEYKLLDAQDALSDSRRLALRSRALPRISAFAQGGAGQPNPFNFLNTDLSLFGQAGIRLGWTLWDGGAKAKEAQLIEIQSRQTEVREAQLDRQLELARVRALEQLSALDALIAQDAEIIALQERMLRLAASELENGVRTAVEYIAESQELTRLRLQRELRQVQRARVLADWRNEWGMDASQ